MKPDNQSWHEYLRGYGCLRWASPAHQHRFHELMGLLQPLYALRGGDLLLSSGPKCVIAGPTNDFARKKGHTPFCFRVQCLITGRLSKYISYERLIEFGILTEDTQTGGPFPREPHRITDRIGSKIKALQSELEAVRPLWDDPSVIPWHERYAEYLQSDHWLSLREQVLRRDGYRCRYTGKTKRPGDPLTIHHLTYERVGCESLDDLVTVCWSYHKNVLHKRDDSQ